MPKVWSALELLKHRIVNLTFKEMELRTTTPGTLGTPNSRHLAII